jgi:hypothetical protein
MIDTSTGRRLNVSVDGNAGPYIILPLERLNVVKKLLDKHKIRYWVDEEVISIDSGPEVAFLNLAHGTDPKKVQQILDQAA